MAYNISLNDISSVVEVILEVSLSKHIEVVPFIKSLNVFISDKDNLYFSVYGITSKDDMLTYRIVYKFMYYTTAFKFSMFLSTLISTYLTYGLESIKIEGQLMCLKGVYIHYES